jgi:hypothetical protein
LCNVLADEDQARLNEPANFQDELDRRSIVDGNYDDPGEQAAPVAGHPFRPVLSPEDDLVAFAESGGGQPGREPSCRATGLLVAVCPAAIAVVVDEELAADLGQITKEVDQRIPLHR